VPFSSHVDDIALQNFNVQNAQNAQNQGQGVHVSFFSKLGAAFWLFLTCFSYMLGSSFKVDRAFFMYLLFEFFFNWLLLAGVRKYLRNHCPLAASFGTKACRFAVGVWFCIGESSCWGGYYVYFSCQTLFFLCYRDIVSVTKSTYSFQLLLVALALMLRFHILQLKLKNKLTFVMNFVLNLLRFVLVGWRRVLFFVTVDSILAFPDVIIYLWCLVNRGIWWGISELIFVSPAGYLNPCALSLSAGVSFQSGLL
jgi:hypothetical protein